jgi:hypothetical protein
MVTTPLEAMGFYYCGAQQSVFRSLRILSRSALPGWLRDSVTYILESGEECSIHIEQVPEYKEDPKYLADLLTYKLSLEAQQRIETSELCRRQAAKRLKTSVPHCIVCWIQPTHANQ